MVTFQILSDFHLEFRKSIPSIKKIADNLILAGDIGNIKHPLFIEFMEYVNSTWTHTFYVLGNHEFYNKRSSKGETEDNYSKLLSAYPNIHFLNRSSFVLEDIEILGCTLWSKPISPMGPDFDEICVLNTGSLSKRKYKPINILNFISFHIKDFEWLQDELIKSYPINVTKRLVITHFLPLTNKHIPDSPYLSDKFADSYFGNEFMSLVEKTNVWVSGHTHYSFNLQVGINKCMWLCNAYGYPDEINNYDDKLTFSL